MVATIGIDIMNLNEALHETVSGSRFSAAHLQSGCYIEHDFARGFVKRWAVDDPSDIPAQCDFVPKQVDHDADWFEVEVPVLADDHSPVDGWGQSTIAAIVAHTAPPEPLPGIWGTGLPKSPSAAVGPVSGVPTRDGWGVPKV